MVKRSVYQQAGKPFENGLRSKLIFPKPKQPLPAKQSFLKDKALFT
jgi:hypothetical protein